MTREGQRNITKERVEEGDGRRGGERERERILCIPRYRSKV